jgi:uncharacterized protein YjcR
VARAVQLYLDGATTRDIGQQLGVDPRTVRRWIAGQVPLRRRGPRGRTDVTDDVVRDLREAQQASYAQIADQVGMSKQGAMQRYWRLTGRPRPDRDDAPTDP